VCDITTLARNAIQHPKMSLHNRTPSIPPSTASSVPRKRNLSASAIPLRPPPNLRQTTTTTATSAPPTPQPVKEEELSDNENDGKDDYGDIGVTGDNREQQNKEDRERLKYGPLKPPGVCVLGLRVVVWLSWVWLLACLRGDLRMGAKRRILLEAFTPEQMQRYEVFRRANLNKSGVKKVPSTLSTPPLLPLLPLSLLPLQLQLHPLLPLSLFHLFLSTSANPSSQTKSSRNPSRKTSPSSSPASQKSSWAKSSKKPGKCNY